MQDMKETTMELANVKKSTRGFASMDSEKQREIARKGGQSVPDEKRSFSQNPELAARAGRKGGQSVNPAKRSFSLNHDLASEAGRKGGHASHRGIRTQTV
jgi:general stress protein YciG